VARLHHGSTRDELAEAITPRRRRPCHRSLLSDKSIVAQNRRESWLLYTVATLFGL
jgi:hypothetical protein